MTNTYSKDQPIEEKTLEELRLIRCCLERLLQTLDGTAFVDYQMEKFGKAYKSESAKRTSSKKNKKR